MRGSLPYSITQVPAHEVFKHLLEKLAAQDYSALTGSDPGAVTNISCFAIMAGNVKCGWLSKHCPEDRFGRFKRRCLLACLGEAARKLSLLWLSLGANQVVDLAGVLALINQGVRHHQLAFNRTFPRVGWCCALAAQQLRWRPEVGSSGRGICRLQRRVCMLWRCGTPR